MITNLNFHRQRDLAEQMGQVTKVRLSCYLVLLSAKPGNKTAAPSWPGPNAHRKYFITTNAWFQRQPCKICPVFFYIKHRKLPGVVCNIVCPSESHLKLKSREISFVQNTRFNDSIFWKFCTEHDSITTVFSAKFQDDLTTETDGMYTPVQK